MSSGSKVTIELTEIEEKLLSKIKEDYSKETGQETTMEEVLHAVIYYFIMSRVVPVSEEEWPEGWEKEEIVVVPVEHLPGIFDKEPKKTDD